MEISRSLVDMGVEDPCFFQQWPMNNSFDELTGFGDGFFESFQETKQQQQLQLEFSNKRSSCEKLTQIDVDERVVKTMRTNSFSSSCETDHQFPNPNNYFNNNSYNNNQDGGIVKPKQEITMPSNNNNTSTISFPSDHHVISQASSFIDYKNNNNFGFKIISQGAKRVSTPTAARVPQVQDHILAERRRREKLSQRFIALSALIPGLKKMDKASVLGDGIKYLKHLKEKVKELEEQARKKSNKESVIVVKRHELYADNNTNSSDENSLTSGLVEDSLPEIEARFSDKDVLISIHCEMKKGVIEKVVNEIEKLHLSVINTSSMTFSLALHIVVIARTNADFSMTVKEFMKNLRSGLKTFI